MSGDSAVDDEPTASVISGQCREIEEGAWVSRPALVALPWKNQGGKSGATSYLRGCKRESSTSSRRAMQFGWQDYGPNKENHAIRKRALVSVFVL
ncbi:unnamed protein product [Gongylonema pulchrum]|uniref:AP2/ERF domain-containing protein n=1 Tax=Gongylonema pulchrum TaxID=637853 RepID=A0A183DSV6_9BILA|nr:unnamed protein product [Gongylonema pulchrum]